MRSYSRQFDELETSKGAPKMSWQIESAILSAFQGTTLFRMSLKNSITDFHIART